MPVQRNPYDHGQVFSDRYTKNPAEVVKIVLQRIPFIRAQNKDDLCFEGGRPFLSPWTVPAQCDGAVIVGFIPLGGATRQVQKSHERAVFLKHFSRAKKKIG